MMLILTDAKTAQTRQRLAQIGWNDRESRASGAQTDAGKQAAARRSQSSNTGTSSQLKPIAATAPVVAPK